MTKSKFGCPTSSSRSHRSSSRKASILREDVGDTSLITVEITSCIKSGVYESSSFSSYVAESTRINVSDDTTTTAVMRRVRQKARIILVCFDSMLDRRKFLLKADDMEMVNDEYQYIVLAIRNLGFGQAPVGKEMLDIGFTPFWEDVNAAAGDGADSTLKAIARKIFIIDLSTEISNKDFLAQFQSSVRNRVMLPPLNCDTIACRNATNTGVGK